MRSNRLSALSFSFALAIGLLVAPTVRASTLCSGVTKDSKGIVSFSWLAVKGGHFIDQNGCSVPMVGLNESNLFTGNANAGISFISQRYAFLKSSIHQNVDRVNFQARWWDQDVSVPDAGTNYKAWLKQYVSMAEAAGNYVELDVGPQFFEPPCGKTISFCPSQDQGTKDYQSDPACANSSRTCPEAAEIPGGDESIPLQALKDLGKLYANDPAIIMDIWNEPLDSNPLNFSAAEYFNATNTRVNAFRSVAPRTPVVIYNYQIMQYMATGKVSPYAQANLTIDMHNYSANLQPSDLLPQIQYYQSRGWGTILGEFGGSTASQTALQSVASLAGSVQMGATYFEGSNLYDTYNKTPPPYTLNANGSLVQKYFSGMLPTVFMPPPEPSSSGGGSSSPPPGGSQGGTSTGGQAPKVSSGATAPEGKQPAVAGASDVTAPGNATGETGASDLNLPLVGTRNPIVLIGVIITAAVLLGGGVAVFFLLDVPAVLRARTGGWCWSLRTAAAYVRVRVGRIFRHR